MKLLKLGIIFSIFISVNTQASSYWSDAYSNTGNHFYDNYHTSPIMRDWRIYDTDQYISGRFVNYSKDFVLAIKPGNSYILMHHLTPDNNWWNLMSGGNSLDNLWTTRTDDMHIVGDFDGDNIQEILFANPDGKYRTLKLSGSPSLYSWTSMQYATNGNIDLGDKLLSGDFNGDGIDEVMLIKANGSHYTMKLNTTTQSWDILSSANNGKIYWWNISSSNKFVTGDFDNDGKDELLAISIGGWHHTMHYDNNQWVYLEGDGSGQIGWWNIAAVDRYITGDFNNDGSDELLTINSTGGWSHTMSFNNNQWQWIKGNGGSGTLGNWAVSSNDFYIVQKRSYSADYFITLNSNGWWKILQY